MKQLKVFALMLFAGATLFTSCKKDETSPAPSVTVTNDKVAYTITGAADTTITFNVTVAAEGEIETFSIKKTVGTTTTTYGSPTGFAGQTSYVYNFQETFTTTATYPQTFKFMVTDKEGQTAEISVTISKQAAVVETPMVDEHTNGVVWNLIGPNQGAWDLVANAGVSASGTETSKDMKNTSTVAAGWVVEWTAGTGNGTMFVKSNSFDYTNATVEDAAAAYTAGTPSATVTSPAVNDIYVAKLRGGSNYCVIKITGVVTTASDNEDKIEFSYKK